VCIYAEGLLFSFQPECNDIFYGGDSVESGDYPRKYVDNSRIRRVSPGAMGKHWEKWGEIGLEWGDDDWCGVLSATCGASRRASALMVLGVVDPRKAL
jgi:hypothetical protein